MAAQVKSVCWPQQGRIPRPCNRQNAHMVQQMEIAYKAIEKLTARHCAVTAVQICDRIPLLKVQMPLNSACLPGTCVIRRSCEVGVETVRRAYFEGCRVEWSIGGDL